MQAPQKWLGSGLARFRIEPQTFRSTDDFCVSTNRAPLLDLDCRRVQAARASSRTPPGWPRHDRASHELMVRNGGGAVPFAMRILLSVPDERLLTSRKAKPRDGFPLFACFHIWL